MKKILLLVFCIMALGLSGCGEKSSNNSGTGNSYTAEENKKGEKEKSGEEESLEKTQENEKSGTIGDNLEDGDISKEFTIGDLTLILPDNYGYEDFSNDSLESYIVYLNPNKSLADYLRIDYYRDVVKGEATAELVKNYTEKAYTGFKDTLINIYPGAILIKEEPYIKNEEPAYHFVFESTDSGFEFIHDVYLFMANQHDLASVMEVHWKDSSDDFSDVFLEVIQSSKTAGINDDIPNSSKKADTSNSFTNDYGSPTTKCAHPGCNNPVASSGDTNCCTVHSNRCADCGKYIDEDAMYCMDCLYKASGQSTGNGKNSNIGAGGYEMPNENDKSFSDYVKRVDPDLYDELFSE